MSTKYSGLSTVARVYWRDYLVALIGVVSLLLFTGAIAGLVVLVFLSEAAWLFITAAVSFALHFAAMFVRDVWAGEYEPSQMTYSSPRDILALIAVTGVFISMILLVGTIAAYLATSLIGWPLIVGAVIAAYYPVVDVLLIRRNFPTPGAFALVGTIVAINTAVNIHQSVLEALPVIGKRHRPHS